jgi:hypothetical protein
VKRIKTTLGSGSIVKTDFWTLLSYALNNPMKYTDPTGYIPYEFQREAYFNWMTHRDIHYTHDGVYYGDGFYGNLGRRLKWNVFILYKITISYKKFIIISK